jgi:hypothetical protein
MALVVGVGHGVSNVRQQRLVHRHPSAAPTTVDDEVERWLRGRD